MKKIIEKININEFETAREIINIQKKSYVIEAELINNCNIPPLKETYKDLMNSKEEFWVCKINNKICGVISFEIIMDVLDIFKLFVSPDYINQGIGSLLLKNIEEKFININHIKVQTGLKNKPAINFYKKNNFEVIGIEKKENDLEIIFFRKFLYQRIN